MALILLFLFLVCVGSETYVSIYYNSDTKVYSYEEGKFDENAVARAAFYDTVAQIGYDTFKVYANGDYSDNIQSYAAGYAEGLLQHAKLLGMEPYAKSAYGGGYGTPEIRSFIEQNLASVYNKSATYPDDDYFSQVVAVYEQIKGIKDGFNLKTGKTLSLYEFIAITTPDSFAMAGIEFEACTDIIRYIDAGANSKLFFGHNTWFGYGTLLKQYKEYHFEFSNPSVSSNTIYETGTAGMINSGEHFMLTDKIGVIETTINMMNKTLEGILVEESKNHSVYTSVRVVVATRIASTAKEWAQIFGKENSGVVNSNWFALDMNKFTPGTPLPAETVYMLEQIPGLVVYKDVTQMLKDDGYLGSYNVPYFESIRNASGVTQYQIDNPGTAALVSYTDCPRAKILKRDYSKITSMESYKFRLRYDDWSNDTLSLGYSTYVTCSRGEWGPYNPGDIQSRCQGCLDGKAIEIADWKANKKLEYIVSPPHTTNEPFKWSTSVCNVLPHDYMPDVYDFDWTTVTCGEMPSGPQPPTPTPSGDDSGSMEVVLSFVLFFLFLLC